VLTIADFRLTPPLHVTSTSGTILAPDIYDRASPRAFLSLTWSFRPPGQGPQVRQQQPSGPPIPTPQ
jgi:hypothetical protein